MGYRPRVDVYLLQFDDPEWVGLEVRVEEPSVAQIDAVAAMPSDPQQADQAFRQLCEALAPALVEWNLEDRSGQPVPATLDGLRSQTIRTVRAVAGAWLNAVAFLNPVQQPAADPDLEAQLAGLSVPTAG